MCEAIRELLKKESDAIKEVFSLKLEEIDTERGGDAHDLTVRVRQVALLKRVESAEFDLVTTTPRNFCEHLGTTACTRSDLAKRLPMAGGTGPC